MSFANARMYAVTPAVKAHWHRLLGHALRAARLDWPLLDYDAPAPLAALWARDDLGLAMMCGLPFARREPKPVLIAAPIPSPARYGGQPVYFSDIVVRADDPAQTAKVRSLASTPARPIPALVATARIDASALAVLRAALCTTATEPALRDSLVALQLSGFAVPQASDYDLLPPLAALAQRAFASFQLAATIRSETQRWAEVIRRQNLQPQ